MEVHREMMGKKRKCLIVMGEKKIRCGRKYFSSLRVQVRHSDTGRITWQTWHLCKLHFHLFIEDKGKGYYRFYTKKPYKKALVIDYRFIGGIV